MMHMTFYWGIQATILFDGWKTSTWGDYTLSLLALFVVSVFYEYLASVRASLPSAPTPSRRKSHHSDADAPLLGGRKFPLPSRPKLLDSALFGVSVGISYLLMLAVMSFNAGVFIAVVLGFSVGYFFFRSESALTASVASSEADLCACS